MKVMTFEATCKKCQRIFPYPLLPDQSYGEFVAQTIDGKNYAYLNCFTTPTFDRISDLFNRHWPRSEENFGQWVPHCHWLIGKCLDPLKGEELVLAGGPVCVHCGSTDVSYGDAVQMGLVDIPEATVLNFEVLSEAEQEKLVAAFLQKRRAS